MSDATHAIANPTLTINPPIASQRVRGVNLWCSSSSSSFRYSSRRAGVMGWASSSRSRKAAGSFSDMAVSIRNDLADRLLAVMQAGFDRPHRHAKHPGDLIDRKVFEEIQRHRLTLRQRESIE